MNQRPPIPMTWIDSPEDIDVMLESFRTAESVHFDFETTGLHEYAVTHGKTNGGVAARVVLASFTIPQADEFGEWDGREPTTWILPLSHPDSTFLGAWRKILKRIFGTALELSSALVGHNVKFDSRYLYATTGVDVSDILHWDTAVSSHLLDENSSAKLKDRAPETFGIDRWDDGLDLTYPGAADESPLIVLGEYAAYDTYWTWRLYQNHLERLRMSGEEAQLPVMDEHDVQDDRLGKLATWVAMPTIRSLAKMEQRGILLDGEWTEQRLVDDLQIHELALDDLSERYEMERDKASIAATSHWFIELTQRAVEAGDLQIAAMTKTGKPQWSEQVLSKQARNGSHTAEQILNARKSSKRAGYLRAWLDSRSQQGAVHSTYHVGGTITGRLSSSGPNMQQVTKQLRPAFIPRPGYVLADIDYSQIELRVAAMVSNCQPMLEALRDGQDLHRLLGARISNKAPEDVTPEERQKAKSANFGLLYGMGPMGFQMYAEAAYGVDMTIEEAQSVYNAFFEQWEGMREWHQRAAKQVGEQGEVTSPIGRVRRLPQALYGNDKDVAHAERNAVNSPVQGFASDMMQMAMASISGVLPGYEPVDGAHVVATVHDSIVVELAEDRWQQTLGQCIDRMTKGLDRPLEKLGVLLNVPILAEAVVGTRWGLDDIKTEEQEIDYGYVST